MRALPQRARASYRWESPMQLCRFLVVLVLVSAVAGCFTFTASSSFTQKDLTKQADAARVTLTTQADVHKLLGEPWISSERWRVEVYRRTGNYRELMVMFGLLPFPVPAPIPTPKEDLTGYTLVTYSTAGVVEGVDTAISKYPDPPLADIQVGDFAFTEKKPFPVGPIGPASQALIVSHERFAGTDVHSCTVLIGCSKTCSASIEMQLDDDTSTKYVLGTLGTSLVPLVAEPGTHTLHFWAKDNAGTGEVSTRFTCPASELRYAISSVLIRITHPMENLFRANSRLEGAVQIQDEVPAELKGVGVLLWTNGRWRVER